MPGSQGMRLTTNCEYLACSGLDAAGVGTRAVGAWARWIGCCERWECGGLGAAGAWGMVGRMLRALGSVVVGTGIRAREGGLRPPSGLLARKNGACLRFNFARGSSLKSCGPSTCGFMNALCLGTGPAGFKTCRFFLGSPGPQEPQTVLESKERRLVRRGAPIALDA